MELFYVALLVSTCLNLYLVFRPEISLKERRKESILKFNKDNNLAEYDPVSKRWICKSLPIGYCDQDGNVVYADSDLLKMTNECMTDKKITSEHIPVFTSYV